MGEAHDLKLFTVEEANRLLPQLSEWIQELQKYRDAIMALEVEIDALELIAVKDASGTSPVLDRKVEEYTRLVNQFYAGVDKIHGTGCLLKDLDTGLIDFYSMRKKTVVFLCWKQGEAAVQHWHEINGGFASRQPLS